MAAREAGSTPADSRRSAISRAPRPASMRMRVSPDSTTVVLPELPDPRTRNLTARMLSDERATARPVRGRLEKKPRGRWWMIETLMLSLLLQPAPPARPPRMDPEEVEEFLE